MTKLIFGDRIGKHARLVVSCAAVILDAPKQKVVLTRRSDNGLWCLPGGGMDPGESAVECCVRESMEETGLEVQVNHLIGVYTSPHLIIEYPDGNRYHMVTLNFEAEPTGGELTLSDETTAYGYFSRDEMAGLEVVSNHELRIADAFAGVDAAFVR